MKQCGPEDAFVIGLLDRVPAGYDVATSAHPDVLENFSVAGTRLPLAAAQGDYNVVVRRHLKCRGCNLPFRCRVYRWSSPGRRHFVTRGKMLSAVILQLTVFSLIRLKKLLLITWVGSTIWKKGLFVLSVTQACDSERIIFGCCELFVFRPTLISHWNLILGITIDLLAHQLVLVSPERLAAELQFDVFSCRPWSGTTASGKHGTSESFVRWPVEQNQVFLVKCVGCA